MTDPVVLLDGVGERARLVGAGGSVVTVHGRLTLRGPFRLEVAGSQSEPLPFDATSGAIVIAEGDQFRLVETAGLAEFVWPASVRLTDDSDPRAPWLRFSHARLWQPKGLGKALLSLDRLAASLVGDAPDGADDTFAFPARNGRTTRPLTKPSHPDFPSAAGYFLYPLNGAGGVLLGTLSQRANLSHAEAVELVIFQGRAELWFQLPSRPNEPAPFVARSIAPRGITLTAATPGAGGVLAASNPGARTWSAVDLTVETVFSDGGQLRVARDTKNKGGFADGQVWIARASASTPLSDATGVFSPTECLTLQLELPPDAEIALRLPEMRLGYQGSDNGSRYGRFFGIRVAGLSGRNGAAAVLDADYAGFELRGSKANPALHLKGGLKGHWLAPKPIAGEGVRRLEVSAGDLGLLVEADSKPSSTAMELDTERELLTLKAPRLLAAPVGVTSQTPAATRAVGDGYKRWSLTRTGVDPKVELRLTPVGLRAVGDWASGFSTTDPTQTYSAVDHPGLGIIVDGEVAQFAARDGQGVKTSFTVKNVNGKETVVYRAFVALLAYIGVQRAKDGGTAFLDPYKTLMQFTKLDDSKYVKNATAKGLQLVYVTTEAGAPEPGAAEGLHGWIEANRAASDNGTAKEFFWPFAFNLSVQLRSEASGRVEYADDIVRSEHPDIAASLKPAIAFDMSAEASLDPTTLGWTSWDALAAETPGLWPRANGGTGARMDPSVAEWRGIVMRDLPLKLAVNSDALSKMPEWVQKLVKSINKYLMLNYAFRDESGVTWKGGATGIPQRGEEIIVFESWRGFFQTWLHDLSVLGAGGAIRAAECDVEFVLPKIKNKHPKPNDPDDSVRVRAKFGLDLENKKQPIGRLDVRYNGDVIETDSIPGFKSISIKRIASNFETVQIEMDLVATPTLAEALPFLSGAKPQPAFLAFNLKGPPAGVFDLSLPSEIETNLFRRWPLKVQSMRLGWGNGANVWLEVTGRINLGMASLSSVGATVRITETNGNLDFDLRLNEVAVSLSLGGAEISGRLGWGDADPKQTKVPFADINQPDVRDRDIRGALQVKTNGFLGDNDVAFRSGNKGEVSYWVASAVHSGKDEISLGFGKLKNPGLLIAQNADLDGQLRSLALSPEGAIFANLRPTGAAVWDWLNQWKQSSEIGTVLAASGYFTVDEIVKAPVDNTQITQGQEKSLSGVLWIDTGVLRVDGVARLFTDTPAYFGIGVDFKERNFFASFQTGPIKVGNYAFQPGKWAFGFGFGDRRYFDGRIGWPSLIGEFERDWSQSLHFHLPEMPPPVNAGWGGMRASIKEDEISFGIAFRVGWMRGDGTARGGTGGGYSIGYALGGLMEFTLSMRASKGGVAPALQRVALVEPIAGRAGDYAAIAIAAAAKLDRTDFAIAGEWFGDVWGSAWLEFMGITLVAIDLKAFARYRLAGSLNNGVTDARATCGFSVSVTILCITYNCEARYDIVAVDGGGQRVRFDEFSAVGPPARARSRRPALRPLIKEAV